MRSPPLRAGRSLHPDLEPVESNPNSLQKTLVLSSLGIQCHGYWLLVSKNSTASAPISIVPLMTH